MTPMLEFEGQFHRDPMQPDRTDELIALLEQRGELGSAVGLHCRDSRATSGMANFSTRAVARSPRAVRPRRYNFPRPGHNDGPLRMIDLRL